MSELTEYIADHKDVINNVALMLDKGEDVPASDVAIYIGYKQLQAIDSAEQAEKTEAMMADLKMKQEAYKAEAEHASMVLDALVAHSLELWENAS